MKLGFHYHIPAIVKEGKIKTMSLQGVFLDSLAPHCEKIILFLYTPLESEMALMDYDIVSSNIELVSLVKHYNIPTRLALSWPVKMKISQRAKEIDILLLRAPTPLLPPIVQKIKSKCKYAYLVVGQMADHIDHIQQAKWRKPLLKKYILWNEGKQKEYAKDALVLSNNVPLFEHYKEFSKNTYLVRTTTLKKSDFYIREDTCKEEPYKILYTGRIDKAKGIFEMVEAIGILKNEGINCVLDIVGWGSAGDSTTQGIIDLSERMGVKERIIFHGQKKAGEELFMFYKKADIFINASQVSEGFPRTITEALAHSLPVISTNVGSIGYFHKHKHDIMMVETRNPVDIAEKVKEIINNPELRKKLIKNGFQSVQEVTLEFQAKKITDIIKNYLEQK